MIVVVAVVVALACKGNNVHNLVLSLQGVARNEGRDKQMMCVRSPTITPLTLLTLLLLHLKNLHRKESKWNCY